MIKPMLATAIEHTSALNWPLMATPKLDGIRCIIVNGQPLSRKLKPIPNKHAAALLKTLPDGLDGELMCFGKTFNETQSLLMSEEGTPDFTYCVFDYIDANKNYVERIDILRRLTLPAWTKLVLPITVDNEQQLLALEKKILRAKYEGVMLRKPSSPYKYGRSTFKEGYLLKLKRFKDSEAEIVGFEEKMKNNNTPTKDELGHTKRSSHKANKKPAGTLGKLIVQDVKTGILFSIGTGFNDKLRKHIWKNRKKYKGKIVNYIFQDVGMKNKPRFPSFRGFRND